MPATRNDRPEDERKDQPGYSRTEHGRKPPLDNLGPRTRFSLFYYLSLLIGFVVLQMLLFSGAASRGIPYNEFHQAVTEKRVERVVITEDRIYGRFTTTDASVARDESEVLEVPAVRAPWHPGKL